MTWPSSATVLLAIGLVLGLAPGLGCREAAPTPPDAGADVPAMLDLAPPAMLDVAAPDPAPLADPIPAEATASGLTVTLEELATMPESRPSAEASDGRLRRRCRINHLGELPDGSGRLFVPDLNGILYLLRNGAPQVYLDVGAAIGPDFWNHRGLGTGFGFVAFHPDFASNGVFYTVHTEARAALVTRLPSLPSQDTPAHHGVLTEWKAADPRADNFTGTRREVLRIGFRTYIHGIQEIGFNPTAGSGDHERGWLYVAVGDGGAGLGTGDPQDLARPHGKLLRIDPTGTAGPGGAYGIPPGNPLVGRAGALPEIFAYGLRDPHRFSWGEGQGAPLYLANIGEHNIEMVYEVRPGDNFGWPEREGPFRLRRGDPTCSVYPLPEDDARFGYTYPVIAYDHDPPAGFTRCVDTGDAIAGGFMYGGTAIPQLRGHYVFGDIVNGQLFHARAGDMRRSGQLARLHRLGVVDGQGQPVGLPALAGDPRVDLRFGRDAGGELYLLSKANGKIWRVKRAPMPIQDGGVEVGAEAAP
jgi:Glucose / Sorbosone dehydrogenase